MFDWLEIVGYVGSVLIAVSLMMSNIKKLRWINLFGASIFSVYGGLIEAYPVMILNAWIALTNVYFLQKMYRFKDQFDTLYYASGKGPLVEIMVDSHYEDIKSFFPKFDKSWLVMPTIVIMRNLKPVGLFMLTEAKDGQAEVLIDYATPDVRDRKNTEFLFESRLDLLKGLGITNLKVQSTHGEHKKFLKAVGFRQIDNEHFVRDLN
ncbi:hypothetical protein [Flocculibacter collagenilyticus]|uniref:hypothetical protein n=1 Tax=Flocculibacter collagenilyticus TaxID=2744479 RepID=UPI0018F74AD3|nr:hypothetical protein [Flocculibacter collagenilyticus]